MRRRARAARLARGLSLRQAAQRSGLARDSIVGLEGGHRQRITLRVLHGLAVAYEVDLAALVRGWRGWRSGAPPARRTLDAGLDDLDVRWRRSLRSMREDLDVSQSDLARRTGIGQPVINRWESGTTAAPDMTEVYAVARALSLHLIHLLD